MFKLKLIAPVLLLGVFAATTNAQDASFANTYRVQVKIEMWTSGASGWQTVLTTQDQEEAQLMAALLEFMLENGNLSELLDLSFYYMATDVRVRTEYPEQLWMPATRLSSRESFVSRASYRAP